MNKKEFITELKNKLSILETTEIDDIISEYETHISNKIKEGKSEKEAIKSFGEIDELAKEILSAYKIKSDYKEEDSISKFQKGADRIFEWIGDKFQGIENYQTKDLGKLIFLILLGLILIFVLKIPFEIFKDILISISRTFMTPMREILRIIFSLCVDLGYLVFIAIVIIAIVRKTRNINSETIIDKAKNQTKIKKESTKEEKALDNSDVTNETAKYSVGNLAYLLLRIIVGCMSLPLLMPYIFSLIALGSSIAIIIKGVVLIGLIIGLLGAVIIAGSFFEFIYRFVFVKPQSKSTLIAFIIGLILSGFGLVIFIFEIIDFDVIDRAPLMSNKQKIETRTYALDNFEIIIDVNNESYTLLYDENLNNEVKIEYKYHEKFIKTSDYISNDDNKLRIHCQTDKITNYGNVAKMVIYNLKDKKIYNYEKLYEADIIIYINELDKNRLQIN